MCFPQYDQNTRAKRQSRSPSLSCQGSRTNNFRLSVTLCPKQKIPTHRKRVAGRPIDQRQDVERIGIDWEPLSCSVPCATCWHLPCLHVTCRMATFDSNLQCGAQRPRIAETNRLGSGLSALPVLGLSRCAVARQLSSPLDAKQLIRDHCQD